MNELGRERWMGEGGKASLWGGGYVRLTSTRKMSLCCLGVCSLVGTEGKGNCTLGNTWVNFESLLALSEKANWVAGSVQEGKA